MALTPEQSLQLSTFTDFEPLVNEYLDEFTYLILFDPTNPLVSSYTPTAGESIFLREIFDDQRPLIKRQLAKIIKFTAVGSQDTAGQVIILLRNGAVGTTTVIFNIFKSEIPKLVV